MKVQTVKGAAGVNLHVREYGKSTGVPILLIHGWSQSHLCWSKQYGSVLKDDARIVALDLRIPLADTSDKNATVQMRLLCQCQ